MIHILLDESEIYSNDARYCAAWVIKIFDSKLLKKYKRELLQAQNNALVGIRPYNSDQVPNWLLFR